MKIGIVCYPTYGGSGVVATELGLEMAADGHEVHFISYSKPVRLNDGTANVFYHEVIVTVYPLFDYSPYELVLTSTLVRVAKEVGLDLLHVHYAIPHASAAYMAKSILASEGITLPIVCTLHGTDITLVGKDASFEPVISFAINNSDAVTAVSASLKSDTLQFFRVNTEIEVIPNFINLERYENPKSTGLRKSIAPNGEHVIVHVSNFRKIKRVQDVLSIFDGIRKEKEAKLVLVGDGPELYGIEQSCKEMGLIEDVHFLGRQKEVEPLLMEGDLFILPSTTESFGLAALEAMAAGMPVISTNGGGFPEVNEHGFSGFLSDVGDVEEMSSNALVILNDLETYRANAKIQAAKFDIQVILPRYTDLYDSLLTLV